MPEIVVLGVFVADAVYRADRLPRMGETLLGRSFALGPGGKGSNQAIAIARLGGAVELVTCLGQDDFAQLARQVWDRAGVKPNVREIADSYTGSACIFVDDATGENAIIIAPGAGGRICTEDADRAANDIARARVFLTQLEQPVGAARRGLEIARRAGVATVLNPAPATEPLPDSLLALCDFITPNETEARALTDIDVTDEGSAQLACDALKARGVGRPMVTMGARGVFLDGHGLVPARDFGPAVDTTGAGDAFNAGFALGLARGLDAVNAARLGCAIAGLAVTRHGAATGMPSLADVRAAIPDFSV